MKLGIIKTVEKNGVQLQHTRHLDDWGIPHDLFDVIVTDEKGHTIHFSHRPPIKTNNYDRNTPIGQLNINDYSEEEMLAFLDENPVTNKET